MIRPVALVGVEIDHHRLEERLITLQMADGDRDIIEHAVSLAAIGEGVMRPAREVTGDAVFERRPRRAERARGRGKRARGDRRMPRKAEPLGGDRVVLACSDRFDVIPRVHAQQITLIDRSRIDHLPDALRRDGPRALRKLLHRKRMPRRQVREVCWR